MKNLSEKLTIIVPTRNRPAFVRRLFHFMTQMEVPSQFLVIDSSDQESFDDNARTIAAASPDLRIEHRHDQAGMITKCRKAMETVDTPYTVFCADDDFVLPDSVDSCIRFLDENEGYFGATGSWVSVNTEKENRCHQTRCFTLAEDDPLDRFGKLVRRWFATFYCVYRTDLLTRSWIVTDDACDYDKARVFAETMLAKLSVVYGKLAILPQLHLLFQLHEQNEHRSTPLVSDPDSTAQMYEQFAEALATEIADVRGSDREEARSFVDQYYGFWRDGTDAVVPRKGSLKRFTNNLKNQVLLTRDRIITDPVNIWLRRRIAQSHPLCQSTSWQLAYDLACRFPHGMPKQDFESVSVSDAA